MAGRQIFCTLRRVQKLDVRIGKKSGNHEVIEANYRKKFEKYKIAKVPERTLYL